MKTISKRAAETAGYRALTNPYYLPKEREMLEGVLADMRRGNIDHAVVRVNGGGAVYRRSLRMATTRTAAVITATTRRAA